MTKGKKIKCAKCGACTSVCPVYRVTGREAHTARGRLHLLNRLGNLSSANCGDIFSSCLLCGACLDVCPRKIDTISPIIRARKEIPYQSQPHFFSKLLSRKALSSPWLLEGLSGLRLKALKYLPQESGLWYKLAILPEDLNPVSLPFSSTPDNNRSLPPISYFSGCLARHVSTDISQACHYLLSLSGRNMETPTDQTCCGLASYACGNKQESRKMARKNIAAFADHNLPILTSCASCFHHLLSYPDLLADDPKWAKKAENFAGRLLEFSTFFQENIPRTLFSVQRNQPVDRIFYHDPCHFRFGKQKISAPPRQLIQKYFGAPPVELAGGPHCCGQGGLFHLAHRDLSQRILAEAMQQFMELQATQVVTTCSGCLLQWQQGLNQAGSIAKAKHLAVLLAEQLWQYKQK